MTQKKVAAAPKWAHLDLTQVPHVKTSLPGPKSKELHTPLHQVFQRSQRAGQALSGRL